MLAYVLGMMQMLWLRLEGLREEGGGPTTEQVLVTAALAGLAIAAGGIIVSKVTTKANSINLGP